MFNAHSPFASRPLTNERGECPAKPHGAPFTRFWRRDAAYIDPFMDEWARGLIASLIRAAAAVAALVARFFPPPATRRPVQRRTERHI